MSHWQGNHLIVLLASLVLLSVSYPVAHRYVAGHRASVEMHATITPREILTASTKGPIITSNQYERTSTPIAQLNPLRSDNDDGTYNPFSIKYDIDGGVIGMVPKELRVEYRLADPKLTVDLPMGLDMTHPRLVTNTPTTVHVYRMIMK